MSGGLDLYWGVSGFVVKWVEAPIRREGLVSFIFIFFEVRGMSICWEAEFRYMGDREGAGECKSS